MKHAVNEIKTDMETGCVCLYGNIYKLITYIYIYVITYITYSYTSHASKAIWHNQNAF